MDSFTAARTDKWIKKHLAGDGEGVDYRVKKGRGEDMEKGEREGYGQLHVA